MLLEGWGQPGEDLARRPADALVVRHDQRGRHAGLGVHKLQWGEGEAGLTLCPIWGHSLGENSPALVRGCLVNNDPQTTLVVRSQMPHHCRVPPGTFT